LHLNVEIKARTDKHESIKRMLMEHNARFVGLDHQVDTYFNLSEERGRLKLREGNIENSLIHYKRNNQSGPKRSEVTLYHPEPGTSLKTILSDTLGVFKIVDKERQIFFIENVKFHLDQVKGLGSFVEIEAIDMEGSLGEARLKEQCEFYMKLFEIKENDLLESSYSDMV